jgi:pimeloyl-ACP methyl ester carboxylesterase
VIGGLHASAQHPARYLLLSSICATIEVGAKSALRVPGGEIMQRHRNGLPKIGKAAAVLAFCVAAGSAAAQPAGDPPLSLAREGFFYAGGKFVTVKGRQYMTGQMYVEYRIPAAKSRPYPIVMVHGGTMSGTNYTGTPDGREGWAQNFVRQGYAVYVVDQPGRGRSPYQAEVYGPAELVDRENSQRRYIAQEKYKLWPQAHLHTQWPGSGEPDDPIVQQLVASQLPAIRDFTQQQVLNRDALVALLDRIGPAILLVHSQAGAFGWPVADARPDLVKAILAIEPNGPPAYGVEFVGAPDYFRQGRLALTYGISAVPLTYSPPLADAAGLAFVQQDKADAPDLVRCWMQKEPARQLPRLQKMPVLILTAEASYHAPYDHCTVKYLRQAGVRPDFVKLVDLGIRGNSHVMMLEKNSRDIAAVIARWLDKALTPP